MKPLEAIQIIEDVLAQLKLSKQEHAKLDACLEVIKSNLKQPQTQ